MCFFSLFFRQQNKSILADTTASSFTDTGDQSQLDTDGENINEDEDLAVNNDITTDTSEASEESSSEVENSFEKKKIPLGKEISIENTSPENIHQLETSFDSYVHQELESDMEFVSDTKSDMELVSDSSHSTDTDEEGDSENEGSDFRKKESTEQVEQRSNDAPLYVIPNLNCTYTAPISYKEHILAVCAYVSRHNCSDTEFKDLLNMLNLHIPENNLMETDVGKVKAMCGYDKTFVAYHFFCNVCKKVYQQDIDRCLTNGCTGDQEFNKNYFVTGNLDTQLSDVLTRKGIWQSVQDYTSVSSKSVTDIISGTEYHALKEVGKFLNEKNRITLSLFTDGIPLFKSSGVSLWPVYLLINELPRTQRFLRKNMILWGVWQGIGKPNMTMFLTPLVKDLNRLYTEGTKLKLNGREVVCKAKLVLVTMDLQARASVLHMTQHNGEFPCCFCMEQGQVVKSGKGHTRMFKYRENGSVVRTDLSVRNDSKMAQQQKKRINGFTGESVLLYLNDFSLVSNVTIDYMHGILLGVMKKLLTMWTDTKDSEKCFYIGKHMKEIDKIMKKIHPPYMMSRLPRKLSAMAHWKASEFRSWLLFYAIPCLKGKLADVHLIHFSTLVEATYILLGEGISEMELQRAHSLLCAFVKHTEKLYGQAALGLNFHNLTHLVSCVRRWGPLWAWSCFCFESFNGELKKSVHGTGNVCKQIFWAMQVQKKVETENIKDSERIGDFIKNMTDSSRHSDYEEYYQCLVTEHKKMEKDLPQSVVNSLETINESISAEDYEFCKKIIRNGFQMYSKSCSRVKRRNSYTIQLDRTLEDGARVIEVDYYIVNKTTKHVFAVGKKLKPVTGVLQNRVPHLQMYEYCR